MWIMLEHSVAIFLWFFKATTSFDFNQHAVVRFRKQGHKLWVEAPPLQPFFWHPGYKRGKVSLSYSSYPAA